MRAIALFLAIACVVSHVDATYKCKKAKCDENLEIDCHCASTHPPGGLKPEDTPMFILITNDDAVTQISEPLVRSITNMHTNPNGCMIPATYYVSIAYTSADLVKQLHKDGNEIATHTFSHVGNPDIHEIESARSWIHNNTHIPLDQISGFRAPELLSNQDTRKSLHDLGFKYDCSITESSAGGSLTSPAGDTRLWPYTMDYGIPQTCTGGAKCDDTERYPGLWEIPMWTLEDDTGRPIGIMDPVVEDLADAYFQAFNRSYYGNRSPIGVFFHAAWLAADQQRIGHVNAFLERVLANDDVWVVTTSQLIDFMRHPMPKDKYAKSMAARRRSDCNDLSSIMTNFYKQHVLHESKAQIKAESTSVLKGKSHGKARGKSRGKARGKAGGKAHGKAGGKAAGENDLATRTTLKAKKGLPIFNANGASEAVVAPVLSEKNAVVNQEQQLDEIVLENLNSVGNQAVQQAEPAVQPVPVAPASFVARNNMATPISAYPHDHYTPEVPMMLNLDTGVYEPLTLSTASR